MGECMRVRACVCVGVGARARACTFECVALLIQHARRMRHIACGLSGSTIYFDTISQTARFRGEGGGRNLLNTKWVF